MKVYFSASISGRKNLLGNYRKIYDAFQEMGVTVLSDHVLRDTKEKISVKSHEEVVKFYKKIVNLISKSDIVVIEASSPSINLGHEISVALEKGKPTVVLYLKGAGVPRMLEGSQQDRLLLIEYQLETLKRDLKEALDFAKDQMDVRFNFFVSPKIVYYLDWIAKKKKMPRAVYLRRLIEQEMKKNKEFLKDK